MDVMEPRFLVVGAGRVGTALAVFLRRARADVTILMRPEQARSLPPSVDCSVRWLRTDIAAGGGDTSAWITNIPVVSDPRRLPAGGEWVIILAVRSYQIEAALQSLLAVLTPERIAAVVVPTNGLGAEERVIKALGQPEKVISAAITYPCERTSYGVFSIIVAKPEAGIALASVAPPTDCLMVAYLTDLLRRCGKPLNVQLCFGDWQAMKWTKLLLNMIGNAIPAILNWPLDWVYADWRLCRLELLLVAEFLEALKWRQLRLIDLPGYPVAKLRPLIWLARLQSALDDLVGFMRVPAVLYRRLIVPKILAARGGKPPSLLLERQMDVRMCENLHLDLIHAMKPGELPIVARHRRLGCALRDCFEKGERRYDANPALLLAACRC